MTKPSWLVKPASLLPRAAWPARRRWLVLVPSVLACGGLAAAVVFLAVAGGSGLTARPRATALASPNPDSTEPVPTFRVPAPVNPVALPSTGAIPLPASEQTQVTAWSDGRGGAALQSVSSGAGDVAQASGLKQYVEMKAACSQLAASVSAAQAAPPIPDAAMQEVYQEALGQLGSAASACQAAISEQPDGDEYVATTENKSALKAAEAALGTAARELFVATGGIGSPGSGH
jgi:hypothetical protein